MIAQDPRQIGVVMKIPHNVVWFEILLYVSLMLDSVSVALADRPISSDLITPMALEAGLILLLVYFVHLAAQKRKNWPRWVLLALLVLSVLALLPDLAQRGIEISSAIEIVSCVLTAAGLYSSFTGDARGWFNA